MSGDIVVQGSFISWVVKMGAKRVSKGMLKNFIQTRIIAQLNKVASKDLVKRFAKEADDILGVLDDPWWATAIGVISLIGDAFDLARVPKQIRKAIQRAEELEDKVEKILQIQGKKALELIPGSLKRSSSYASELEDLTYAELLKRAKTSSKAAGMKKLIEQEHRLLEKR